MKDKTVPIEKCKPSKGTGGGPTNEQRLKNGRNMARVVSQKGK
jgi:hypothetical protein